MADFFGSNTLANFRINPEAGSNLTTAAETSNEAPILWRNSNDPGLNVYNYTATSPSSFTENELAFTGSATWTMPADDYNAAVALGIRSGDIYFPADQLSGLPDATLIGEWQVIPEPRAAAFVLALGALGLVVARRRKR